MKKPVIALCGIMLSLLLAGCGGSGEFEEYDDYEEIENEVVSETVDLYGVWEDVEGDMIEFLPDESAYILKKWNGRVGRGTYTPGESICFNRFIYTFGVLDDGSITLYRNGSPEDESEESLDGFIFFPSDETGIEENDLSLLEYTWVNDAGTTITFDTEAMEYYYDSEMTIGSGNINDENDGRGIFVFTHGRAFIIFNDDGSLSFETDNTDLSGDFYVE